MVLITFQFKESKMAFLINFEKDGVTYPDAYLKFWFHQKEGNGIIANFGVYNNEEIRQSGEVEIGVFGVYLPDFEPPEDEPIKAIYEKCKAAHPLFDFKDHV